MKLEQKISEEEKQEILREISRELITFPIEKVFERGMEDPNVHVKAITAENFEFLARINLQKYLELVNKGLKDKSDMAREYSARSLIVLADLDFELYERHMEKGMKSEDLWIRRETANNLRALAAKRPKKFIELVEKGLNDSESKVRREAADALGALAPVDKEKYLELFERAKKDGSGDVKFNAVGTLVDLATADFNKAAELIKENIYLFFDKYTSTKKIRKLREINPDKLLELFEWGMTFSHPIKSYFAEKLKELITINQDKFVELIEKGMNDAEANTRAAAFKSLESLAYVDADKYVKWVEKGMNDPSRDVRYCSAEALGPLATIDLEKYVELVKKGIEDSESYVRRGAASSLGTLALLRPKIYAELVEKLSEIYNNDPNDDVCKAAARTLDVLAASDPDEYEKIFRKIMKGVNPQAKEAAAATLSVLALADKERYLELYNLGIKDEDINVQSKTVFTIRELVKIDIEKYYELLQEAKYSREAKVVGSAAETLGSLVHADLERYLKLFNEFMDSPYEGVRYGAIISLYSLVHMIKNKEKPLEEGDEVCKTIKDIVELNQTKTKQEILDYLKRAISNSNNLIKVGEYARKGLDLDSADECSRIHVPAYEVVRKLGEGGFGKTYLIEHKELGTKSVLKICGSNEALGEAKKYAVLKGKRVENIAEFEELYDRENSIRVGNVERSAIKIEYIKGRSLREILEEDGAIDKKKARKICEGILNGIKELNEHGLIHRDIKPENVMISEDGSVKLIDLGVTSSTAVPEEFTLNRLYAAPEGRKGKTNNPNFDYWGFGLTLYEMLTGSHLIPVPEELKKLGFDAALSRYKSIVRKEFDDWIEKEHEADAAKKYKDMIRKLPGPYAKIVDKCLRRPEERYQSVDEIVKDLTAKDRWILWKNRFDKAVNIGGKILSFGVVALLGYGAVRMVKGCYSLIDKGIEQGKANLNDFNRQAEEIKAVMEKQAEARKDPPHIEVVRAEPQEAYALEPVTFSAKGKKLEHKWVHWVFPKFGGYETEFNGVEVKHVFTEPGEYDIQCQNYFHLHESALGPFMHGQYVHIFVKQRDNKDNQIPQVAVDAPEWVKKDETFAIDASKSRDLDGNLLRYYIEFGDGEHREGEITDNESLIFHHQYTKEDIDLGSSHIHNPMNYCLVLYDDGGANFARGTIKVKRE
jgi:serine/threonine protein kinase/HEAT repeat protein